MFTGFEIVLHMKLYYFLCAVGLAVALSKFQKYCVS